MIGKYFKKNSKIHQAIHYYKKAYVLASNVIGEDNKLCIKFKYKLNRIEALFLFDAQLENSLEYGQF